MRIIVSRGRVGMHTHTNAVWNPTSLMQAFVLLLRVYLKRKTSCAPAKIYSAAVQALSIQTRRSLPAGSQRRQHSCLQQHCRPLRDAWTVTICNAMRVFTSVVFLKCLRVHGTEMRLDCTWKSWSLAWNRQLFSLCGAARKEAFSSWQQLLFLSDSHFLHPQPAAVALLINFTVIFTAFCPKWYYIQEASFILCNKVIY